MTATGPGWLADLFAATTLAVALHCGGRLVASRVWDRRTHVDIDASHVMMGVAMAGMLVPRLAILDAITWEVVFGLNAAWFAWRSLRLFASRAPGADGHAHHGSHYPAHVVMALAMLYMYLAPGGMSGGMTVGAPSGTAADFVGLPLVFLVTLLVSGIWELDGLGRLAAPTTARLQPVALGAASPGGGSPSISDAAELPAGEPAPQRWLPRYPEAACHVVMCVTMAYMLILML